MFFSNLRKEKELLRKQMLLEVEQEKFKLLRDIEKQKADIYSDVVALALRCAREKGGLEHDYHARQAEVKEVEAKLTAYKQLEKQLDKVMEDNSNQYEVVIKELKEVLASLNTAVIEASKREIAVVTGK